MNREFAKKAFVMVVTGMAIALLAGICSRTVVPSLWLALYGSGYYRTEPLMQAILTSAMYLPALIISAAIGWWPFRRFHGALSRGAVFLWVCAPWMVTMAWGVAQIYLSGEVEPAMRAEMVTNAGFWSGALSVPLGLLLAGYLSMLGRVRAPALAAAGNEPSRTDLLAFDAIPKLFVLAVIALVSLIAGAYVEGWLAYRLLPMLLISDYYLTGFLAFSGGAIVMAMLASYPLVTMFGARAWKAGLAIPAVLLGLRIYNLAFAHIGRTPQELLFNSYEAIAAAALIYATTSMLSKERVSTHAAV